MKSVFNKLTLISVWRGQALLFFVLVIGMIFQFQNCGENGSESAKGLQKTTLGSQDTNQFKSDLVEESETDEEVENDGGGGAPVKSSSYYYCKVTFGVVNKNLKDTKSARASGSGISKIWQNELLAAGVGVYDNGQGTDLIFQKCAALAQAVTDRLCSSDMSRLFISKNESVFLNGSIKIQLTGPTGNTFGTSTVFMKGFTANGYPKSKPKFECGVTDVTSGLIN